MAEEEKIKLLSNLDVNKRYILVGVSKCGTTSMVKYLTENGFSVEKQDGWFWNKQMVDDFGKLIKTRGREPLVVLRNPIERAWSHYHYTFQNKPEEKTDDHIKRRRLEEYSRKSQYLYFLARWFEKFPDMVVFNYEDFVELKDFPHENKTKYKPPLPQETVDLIAEYMDAEAEDMKIYSGTF